ncbi:hypothetical protein [Chryseobacterium indologenes]|uniref:hypothetical protein n=1 Tax=Chryseobacterium indologenes TaxID=253 RepID=UPI003017452F
MATVKNIENITGKWRVYFNGCFKNTSTVSTEQLISQLDGKEFILKNTSCEYIIEIGLNEYRNNHYDRKYKTTTSY